MIILEIFNYIIYNGRRINKEPFEEGNTNIEEVETNIDEEIKIEEVETKIE